MIDSLYYGEGSCPCCSGTLHNESAVRFDPQVLERYLHKVYEGFDVSHEVEVEAWREVLRIINEGSVEGLIESRHEHHEEAFLRNLRHSNEVFAAFKCHSMGSLMQQRLRDGEGKLRSFEEWKRSVASITSHHTVSWLRTEYDTAILRAHQAADWQEFMRNRDVLPNLRWMPTTSPSPEAVHESFWTSGLTLPVDDPFWTTNHPANRWNCKCSLEATDAPSKAWSEPHDPPKAQPGLEENPRHGRTFSDKHPYFPKDCSACPFYKPKGVKGQLERVLVGRVKDCHSCPYIDLELAKAKYPERYQEYLRLKADKEYREVDFDPETGGLKATHVGHKGSEPHKETYFGGMTSGELEGACCDQLFRLGYKVIRLDEQAKDKSGNVLAALDISLNGRVMDIRSITANSSNYVNALTDKHKQLKRYNKRTDIASPSDSLCLYFYDADMYSEQKIIDSINSYKSILSARGSKAQIKRLFIVVRGRDEVKGVDI
nr:phage minor head protein [uncultured Porphyromonas sp.]